jgi:hypothetical protein
MSARYDGGVLARELERERIRRLSEALERERFVGVTGEAEAGKSHLLAAVARERAGGPLTATLDLAKTYDESHAAWLLLRATAAALVGADTWRRVASAPAATGEDEAFLAVLRALGPLGEVAMQAQPDEELAFGDVVAALARLAREQPVRLVIDHLEAPTLAPRKPHIDPAAILWKVRAESQREPNLQVVVACRPEAVELAAGEHAAFYGDGLWWTAERVDISIWQPMPAERRGGVNLDAILELAEGHVSTTLALLADERCATAEGPRLVFGELIKASEPLASRCLQHARSLHRVGALLLEAVANWLPPYAVVPTLDAKEAYRGLSVLAAAGLIRRPQRGEWAILNPLVGSALRGGTVRYVRSASDQLELTDAVRVSSRGRRGSR